MTDPTATTEIAAPPGSTLPTEATPADLPTPVLRGFELVPRPRSMDELARFSQMVARSDLVPKDYRGRPENVMLAVQMGLDVGLSWAQAIQNIAVINGRPTMWGDAVLAVVRGSGLLDWIEEDWNADRTAARCTVKRRSEEPLTRTFAVADAKAAGLLDKTGPWKQYRPRMLQMRARSWALRDAFPDVLKGLAVREEVYDVHEGETVATPAAPDGWTDADAPRVGVAGLRDKLAERETAKAPPVAEAPRDDASAPEDGPQEAPEDDRPAAGDSGGPLVTVGELLELVARTSDPERLDEIVDLARELPDAERQRVVAAAAAALEAPGS